MGRPGRVTPAMPPHPIDRVTGRENGQGSPTRLAQNFKILGVAGEPLFLFNLLTRLPTDPFRHIEARDLKVILGTV